MILWFETAGIILISALSIFIGRYFSRLKSYYWTIGYFFPLFLIALLLIARYYNTLSFTHPFNWFIAGRARFAVLSLAVCMGLTTPLSRLPKKIEKVLICVIMFLIVTWFSVLPFVIPAITKNYLLNITTRYDSSGICRQSTDYTCGPAAAVTALDKLGFSAQEGEIAVLSQSSPIVGTLPTMLCSTLNNLYGSEGLKCNYRRFNSIEQLKASGLTLAIIKSGFLLDHCVVVLDVFDDIVEIADPVTGKQSMPLEKFEKIWRFSGIVLERGAI